MSLGGAPAPILGTNPLAYAIPRPGMLPVVIDQASSSTAFVNIRRAAEAGDPIPAGWALGPDGEPTQDASAALSGTLLPFGSHRGGNIALLVEVLATFSGASFSLDAAPFDRGTTSPGIGVFLLGIDPTNFGGSVERLSRQFESLRNDHQVRLPAIEITALPDSIGRSTPRSCSGCEKPRRKSEGTSVSIKRMIQSVETHSGEPMRVITGGVPYIPGNSVYEQMKWLEHNDDQLRKLMLREPRGYPPRCCNLIVPPKHPDAAAGFVIMEQIEYDPFPDGFTVGDIWAPQDKAGQGVSN